jgi:dihydrofolate synthase/folylpolyglutamate synthase
LPTDACYYFTQSQIPRALDARELLKRANEFKLEGEQFTNVNLALRSAIRKAEKNDLIIVCGSIFLVAEVNISLITEHA